MVFRQLRVVLEKSLIFTQLEFEYWKQKLASTFWESVQVLDYMNIRKQKEFVHYASLKICYLLFAMQAR